MPTGRRLSPQRARKGRGTECGVQHVARPVLVTGEHGCAWVRGALSLLEVHHSLLADRDAVLGHPGGEIRLGQSASLAELPHNAPSSHARTIGPRRRSGESQCPAGAASNPRGRGEGWAQAATQTRHPPPGIEFSSPGLPFGRWNIDQSTDDRGFAGVFTHQDESDPDCRSSTTRRAKAGT